MVGHHSTLPGTLFPWQNSLYSWQERLFSGRTHSTPGRNAYSLADNYSTPGRKQIALNRFNPVQLGSGKTCWKNANPFKRRPISFHAKEVQPPVRLMDQSKIENTIAKKHHYMTNKHHFAKEQSMCTCRKTIAKKIIA